MNSPPPQVLAAGTNARNLDLLSMFLHGRGYRSRSALGLAELDRALDADPALTLALVDITGFDAAIWQRCRRLHEQGIRLLVIAPRSCAQTQRASLSHGAQGMLVKPLVMRELAALIGALLAE